MTRTTTALAAAAVAAALAAGPIAASTGITAAQWHASDTIAGKTIRTGALEIASVSSGFTNTAYEVNGGQSTSWTSTISGRLEGVDAAILEVRYAWGSRKNDIGWVNFNWNHLHAYMTFDGNAETSAGGRLQDATGVSSSVLILRQGAARPDGTSGLPTVVISDDSFSTNVRLRIYNDSVGTFVGSFRLSEGAVASGHGLTATLTQELPDGAQGPWKASGTANLTTVQNTGAQSAGMIVDGTTERARAGVDDTNEAPEPATGDQRGSEGDEPKDEPGLETDTRPEDEKADEPEQSEDENDSQEGSAGSTDSAELEVSNLPNLPVLPEEAPEPEPEDQTGESGVERPDPAEQQSTDETLECKDLPDLLDEHGLEVSDLAELPSSLPEQQAKTVTELANQCDAVPVATETEEVVVEEPADVEGQEGADESGPEKVGRPEGEPGEAEDQEEGPS